MKLQDILCASFANLIHSSEVDLDMFRNNVLTITTKDKTFYTDLLKVIEEDELDIKVTKTADLTDLVTIILY